MNKDNMPSNIKIKYRDSKLLEYIKVLEQKVKSADSVNKENVKDFYNINSPTI